MKRGQPITTKSQRRKSKSKSKSKEKKPKFDPLQYLNSLIDELHEHQPTKRRGSTSHKRQLASAMAHTTPYTERTAASSKVRSKSSYSQFRKKSTTIRDVLKIDLNSVTEDDNIQFTENTIKDTEYPSVEKIEPVRINRNVAARKIQRAWRNYQTLKVVRKYYEYYQELFRREVELKQLQSNFQQQQLEKREKRESPINKKEKGPQLRIRRQEKRSPTMGLKLNKGEPKTMDFSDSLTLAKTKELIKQQDKKYELEVNELKTIELPILKQPEIKAQNSKQLQQIVQLFRSKEESANKEIESQISAYCKAQADLVVSSELSPIKYEDRGSSLFREDQQDSSMHQLEGLSPLVFTQMEQAVRNKYEIYKNRLQQSTSNHSQIKRSLQQLQGRLLRQLRSIDKCKQQYMRSASQLRESMIKMQNDTAIVCKNSGSYRVRKSYSADTLILKSILEEVVMKNVQVKGREDIGIILSAEIRGNKRQELPHLAIPTSPPSEMIINVQSANFSSTGRSNSLVCYQLDSGNKLRQMVSYDLNDDLLDDQKLTINEFIAEKGAQSPIPPDMLANCDSSSSLEMSLQEMSNREGDRSRMVRECSQQLEVQIEAVLIWQFVEQLYTNLQFWATFKPLVEVPFQFKIVDDGEIKQFLEGQMPKYYLGNVEWLSRMNQKINPTSLEILRLIRDFDFQIEQYELVLPEEVFKSYRKQLEQSYGSRINQEQNRQIVVSSELSKNTKKIVTERGKEKRTKKAKFLSFERDLRIMYMKAVFNCYNELIIETKTLKSCMHGRSSIGPGELTLALKQYNDGCSQQQAQELMNESKEKILDLLKNKCIIPEFKNHRQLQLFQRQMTNVVIRDMNDNEHKWINYMDEVLQIWQDLSLWLSDILIHQASQQCLQVIS